jgi:hypothetical protein
MRASASLERRLIRWDDKVVGQISTERSFRRHYELPSRLLIRREYINSPAKIATLLCERF